MKFLLCPVPSVRVKSNWLHQNHAVSARAVTGVQRSRVNHYNDEVGLPSIKLVGTDVEWALPTLAEREAVLTLLLEGLEQPSEFALSTLSDAWSKRGLTAGRDCHGFADYSLVPVVDDSVPGRGKVQA